MKRGITILSALAVVSVLAVPAWAQARELPTQTTTIAGTIETIDKDKRAMNIKTADGKFVAVNVPESVRRFSEMKVGDKITRNTQDFAAMRMGGRKRLGN